MNERIRELALEAGYQKDSFGVGHWDMPECKKFAELIVRECILSIYRSDISDKKQERLIQELAYKFGVEE